MSQFPLFLPSVCHGMMGSDVVILVLGILSFKPAFSLFSFNQTSLVAKVIKSLFAMQETQVQSQHQEYPLEKEMATHSSILAWKIHGRRSLACYSTWGRKDSDITERLCFLSFFHSLKRIFSSSLLSAIRVVLELYLRLLIFFLGILIPACESSSLAFYMMYSA